MKKNLNLVVLTLLFLLVGGKMTVSAQTDALSRRVSVSVDGGTLDDAVVQIEKQTSLMFFYKTQDIDPDHRVTLHARQEPLSTVLDRLVEGTKLGWELSGNHIMLTPRKVDDQPRVVTGRVTDKAGVPVIGATVIVKGTTVGASTGADGSYTLQVPAPASGAVLLASYLGYNDAEAAVGSRTTIDITLSESSLNMDAVVVTALGIKRSEKALSYNVQQISSDDIIGNKDVNFVNALNGKVAGVNINASSSGVGGASKVVMRGTKGIDQSSNALYVIDGVPMYNLSGEGGTEFDSAGTSEAVADINPEDIESVSVLTGAAAAALYGSYASNGAIVITTKKGMAGRDEQHRGALALRDAPLPEPLRHGQPLRLGGSDAHELGQPPPTAGPHGLLPRLGLPPDGRRRHRDRLALDRYGPQPDLPLGFGRQLARHRPQQRLRPLQLHGAQHHLAAQGPHDHRPERLLHHAERLQHD